MGNSASKSNASAKSAARHFPSAKSAMQEKAAAAAAAAAASTKMNAIATSTASKVAGAGGVSGGSSPKQDYLEQQRRLEEEIARYDEEIKKSGKLGMSNNCTQDLLKDRIKIVVDRKELKWRPMTPNGHAFCFGSKLFGRA